MKILSCTLKFSKLKSLVWFTLCSPHSTQCMVTWVPDTSECGYNQISWFWAQSHMYVELYTCNQVTREAFCVNSVNKVCDILHTINHKASEYKNASVLLYWGLWGDAPGLFPTSCCLPPPAKPPQHLTTPQPCTHTLWDSTYNMITSSNIRPRIPITDSLQSYSTFVSNWYSSWLIHVQVCRCYV